LRSRLNQGPAFGKPGPSGCWKAIRAVICARMAALNERTYLPSVSLRAAFSKRVGNDQLDLRTVSFDLALAKTFAFITPCMGLGQVQVSAWGRGIGGESRRRRLREPVDQQGRADGAPLDGGNLQVFVIGVRTAPLCA